MICITRSPATDGAFYDLAGGACGVFFCRIAFVAAASITIIAKTERTDQGERYVLPGAESSARHAAAARGEKMRPKRPQLPPGGLFEAPEPEEPLSSSDCAKSTPALSPRAPHLSAQ